MADHRKGENYGNFHRGKDTGIGGVLEQQEAPPRRFWKDVLQGAAIMRRTTIAEYLLMIGLDPRILSLSLTSGVFEGAMYIFIFFKFPALKFAHEGSESTTGELQSEQLLCRYPLFAFLADELQDLPFGLIFAILMCSLMLGSMLHSLVTSAKISIAPPRLLIYTLCMASLCFAVPIVVRDERITFWCFCAFEVCCGIYFPSMAHQRERIIEDGMRARMYGIMRIPLNLFVVAVLATTKEGTNILSIPAQF
ncbi:MAG: hypothetical protein CL912_07140 [Deltaproteobacteria bacterium]|nr:hypothetical protein [Deltaproteobacteria bacterium]